MGNANSQKKAVQSIWTRQEETKLFLLLGDMTTHLENLNCLKTNANK